MAEKMVFKTRKPKRQGESPIIRLTTEVSRRLYEIEEQTGLTANEIIRQMLDFIGDEYEVM